MKAQTAINSRALESDTEALNGTDDQVIGLLLLRQSVLSRSTPDNPHRQIYEASRDSAMRELKYRLATATGNQSPTHRRHPMNRIEKAKEFYDNKPYGYWNFDSALYAATADFAESAVREFIDRGHAAYAVSGHDDLWDDGIAKVFHEMFGKEIE